MLGRAGEGCGGLEGLGRAGGLKRAGEGWGGGLGRAVRWAMKCSQNLIKESCLSVQGEYTCICCDLLDGFVD